jgi:acyl-CoA synthetase (AMP-forming)/AMP-acid ligase II
MVVDAPGRAAPPPETDATPTDRAGPTDPVPDLLADPMADLINPLADLIDRRAGRDGARSYLEHARTGRRVTFEHLQQAVADWGTLFDDARIPTRAAVAIVVDDPLDFAEAYLGVIASGRWAAPLDPALPPVARGPLLDRLTASVAITGNLSVPGAAGIVWPDQRTRSGPSERVALTWRPDPPAALPDPAFDPLDARAHGGALLASSGTSGRPKIVPLPTRQLLHAATSVVGHHGLGPADRGFCPLPLFHVNAEVVGLLAQLVAGACLVLDDRFHRTGFWELMGQCDVSWINAVPAIVARLGTVGPDETVPAGVRFIRSASAPLPPATLQRFERHTGIPVVETYGMTEAASQITANPVDGPRKAGTVGVPVGVELRIVVGDERTGVPADADSTKGRGEFAGTASADADPARCGRVEIRGPSVIRRYLGGEHGDRIDPDDWLDTGDMGWLDADGFLTLVGRRDDVINRGGEKMFPREIEEAILGAGGVTAVAVVPGPDDVLGEVPVAYLVLSDPLSPDGGLLAGPEQATAVLEAVRDHLGTALVRAKRPQCLFAVDHLPTGPTGKIQRRLVRADPPAHYAWLDGRPDDRRPRPRTGPSTQRTGSDER